jgi:hypothetical protein
MCKCITTITQKAIDKMKETNPGDKITDGNILNKGFSMSGNFRTYNDFQYSIERMKKNGEFAKPIRKTISLYHSFCPFCGKQIKNKS